MQRIHVIFEAQPGGVDHGKIDHFRRRLRQHYKGVRLESRVEISHTDEGPENLLEAAHDAASRAEEEQRRSGSSFVAYLRPMIARVDFPGNNIKPTGGDDEITIVLIAIAHCRGIGAFRVSRPLARAPVPPDTCLALAEQTSETEGVMRPRTKDPDNVPAAHLGARIRTILDELIHVT